MKLLESPTSQRNVLSLDDIVEDISVKDKVKKLYPCRVDASSSAMLRNTLVVSLEHHPIRFEDITMSDIIADTRCTHESAGPSNMDASQWCEMFESHDQSSHNLAEFDKFGHNNIYSGLTFMCF
ncbi:hypothetical protein GJ496_006634 [Pomphorhynchus laevis]|nr:hypothetical protein GJ496_006634 [Pomphorhynchus laevis]